MRGVRLLTNHCPRIGLLLFAAVGIMLAGSISAKSAQIAAGETQPGQSLGESIRNSIITNWLPPVDIADMKDVHVQIQFALDRAGKIADEPKVTTTGGSQKTQKVVAASALRAVLRASPFKNLPMDQYDVWKEVTINFKADDLGH